MKIKTKLAGGLAVVILATAALGGYATYSIGVLNRLITRVHDNVLMQSTFAQSAQAAFVKLNAAVGDAVAAADSAELERHAETMAVAERHFVDDLTVVEKRATGPAENQALVEEITATFGAWKPLAAARVAHAREALKSGAATAASPLDRVSLDKHRALIEEKLTALTTRAVDEGRRSREASEQLVTLTLYVTYTAVTVAVGITLLVALFLSRSIATPLHALTRQLDALASDEGDLTTRLSVKRRDEIGEIAQSYNTLAEKVLQIMRQVRAAADDVASASRQVSFGAQQLSVGAIDHAASLEQTAASLEEITGTVKQTAQNAAHASQLASGSRESAEKGGSVVTSAIEAMAEIRTSSKKIGEIVATIDEIAFQTNLLALNAAVEAARAGDQGRGFAVVAAEVRNLAQRSASAAKQVKGLIQDAVDKVGAGSERVHQSGQTLHEVVASVKRVTDIIGEIAAACQEQSIGIDQVNQAVTRMDHGVQTNAPQTEELSSTAEALANQAQHLQRLVGLFKLDDRALDGGEIADTTDRPAGPRRPQREVAARAGGDIDADGGPRHAAPPALHTASAGRHDTEDGSEEF